MTKTFSCPAPFSAWSPLRRPLFRNRFTSVHHLPHWQLDAGHSGHVADDGAHDVALAHCAYADGGESASVIAWIARGGGG
jgi:hypothetical protein